MKNKSSRFSVGKKIFITVNVIIAIMGVILMITNVRHGQNCMHETGMALFGIGWVANEILCDKEE